MSERKDLSMAYRNELNAALIRCEQLEQKLLEQSQYISAFSTTQTPKRSKLFSLIYILTFLGIGFLVGNIVYNPALFVGVLFICPIITLFVLITWNSVS